MHDKLTCFLRRTAKDYYRTICIFELIMLKRGLLLVPGIVFFSTGDIDVVMRDICNAGATALYLFIYFLLLNHVCF